MVRRIALLLPVALLAFSVGGAQGTAPTPTASAHALAIRITTPGGGSSNVLSKVFWAAPVRSSALTSTSTFQ